MSSPWTTRFLIGAVAFALCGGPEILQAQQTTLASTTQQQQDSTAPAPATSDQANPQPTSQNQNVGTTQQNASPDPSKGPLQPAETNDNVPNAPTPAQATQKQQPAQQPEGAAAAPGIKAAGGAASRPAGTAIAPAKQHQTRSLLIKIGAIAAGAAALGAIYGLSRSSPSTPPGSQTTTAASTAGH